MLGRSREITYRFYLVNVAPVTYQFIFDEIGNLGIFICAQIARSRRIRRVRRVSVHARSRGKVPHLLSKVDM